MFDREYRREVPAAADLRDTAHEILKDCQLEGAFWVQRPKPDQIQINRFTFRDEVRITFFTKDQRLRAERQQYGWKRVVQRLHFRGGFLQPTFLNDLWAVFVDLACLGILVWVGSGIFMWWRLAKLRLWGSLALAGGAVAFLLLLWGL